MNSMLKSITAIALGLSSATALAIPNYLTTHNLTTSESNAFIDGTIPSPYPTVANSTRDVYWNLVRLACYGHTTNGRCSALIKMDTNKATAISVGTLSMNIESGDISPKQITNNGYTITVNGPGEVTITKAK